MTCCLCVVGAGKQDSAATSVQQREGVWLNPVALLFVDGQFTFYGGDSTQACSPRYGVVAHDQWLLVGLLPPNHPGLATMSSRTSPIQVTPHSASPQFGGRLLPTLYQLLPKPKPDEAGTLKIRPRPPW